MNDKKMNIKGLLVMCLLILIQGPLTAQQATWQADMEASVKWMKVNDYGILIVSTSAGLAGKNPISGETLWSLKDLKATKEENFNIIYGSPVFTFRTGDQWLAINGVNGKVIIDSQGMGFEKVTLFEPMPEIQKVLVEYFKEGVNRLALYDLNSGSSIWDLDLPSLGIKISKLGAGLGQLSGANIAPKPLVTDNGLIIHGIKKNVLALDAATGKVVWQKATKKRVCDLFSNQDKSVVVVVNGVLSNLFKLSSADDGESTSTSQGTVGKFNIAGVDPSSGSQLWAHDYKAKYSGVKASEKDFALFHTVSFNFIDFKSGAKKLSSEPKLAGGGKNSALLITDEYIFTAMESEINPGTNRLHAFDLNGKKLWKKSPRTAENVFFIEKVSDGLLFVTGNSADIIDMTSGKPTWNDEMNVYSREQPIMVVYDKEDVPYLLYDDSIIKILVEEKKWTTLTNSLDRSNAPVFTEFRYTDQGFVVGSPQGVQLIDLSGKTVFSTSLPAPEVSIGGQFLAAFGSAALGSLSARTAVAGAYYEVLGTFAGDESKRRKGNAVKDIGLAGLDISNDLINSVNNRYSVEASTSKYKLILTKKEGKIGMTKVNSTTGTEDGFIITNDRTPSFVVDDQGQMLFFKTKSNQISAYKL